MKQAPSNNTELKPEGKAEFPIEKGISVLYAGLGVGLREPLLHFLLIGAALFVIYHWLNPSAANSDTSRRIELTNDDIRQLEISWTAQWQRPPTPEEMRNLVEDKVRQEILYREGLALGLDRDDTIVKRRLAQKMEFLADDVSALRDPSLDELKKWYAKNGSQFSLPSRITFRHLYFSPDKRGAQARDAAASALEKLGQKMPIHRPNGLGDPFMFQDHYGESTLRSGGKCVWEKVCRRAI